MVLRPLDFIRHGSTKLNDHGGQGDKIRGWIDVPLDDRGKQESKAIGEKLRAAKTKPDVLISSDLRRAVETAHTISSISGIPYMGGANHFRPWNLGHFQGQESKKIAPQLAQYVEHPNEPVPGGESFGAFAHRFLTGLRAAFARFPQARLGMIAHHRNERLLASLDKAGWPPNGAFDVREFERKGDPPGFMVTFNIPPHFLGAAT